MCCSCFLHACLNISAALDFHGVLLFTSVLDISGWFEPRRCLSKQLLNCLSIRTLPAEMVNLPISILQQTTEGIPAFTVCSGEGVRGKLFLAVLAVT
jgi:hypothetical protein